MYEDKRQKLTSYRTIAEALISEHMNHKQRQERISILVAMIESEERRQMPSEYDNTLSALLEILNYVSSEKFTLSHIEVKIALRLFATTCTREIARMADPPMFYFAPQES